ncbi:phage minor head protein [Brevundimonas sp.]|uniref:phage minor head protein n=1 Tax=Brevundimonas sp. TaxID=1871086 RepID=UPI003F7031D4
MAVELKPLPPVEAINFFRRKGLLPSFAWEDVWQEEHARAFTVAKAMRREVLEDIRAALDRALSEGRTLEQFREELTPILQARGWWGVQEMTDPLTGEAGPVQLGSPRRLRTIFDVNMRSAYSAGRWERIQRVAAAMPYLRYFCVGGPGGDGRNRPQHLAWHGTILPVGHPWWRTHYTPCGWRCRCGVQQLNLRTIQRRGWTVTEEPIRFPMKRHVNRRTGEVSMIEEGIDPGFNFNVGEAYLDGITARPLPDVPESGGDDPVATMAQSPAREGELLDAGTDIADAAAAFLAELEAATGRVFQDVAGDRLAIGPALFKRLDGKAPRWPEVRVRSLQLVARAIADPDQIREVWREAEDGRQMLVRRYVAAFSTPDGLIDVMAEFGTDGWRVRSSAEPDFHIVAVLGGRVVYRRESI